MAFVAYSAHLCRKNLRSATPSALAVYDKAVRAKRLVQDEQYDIFLPSKSAEIKSYPVGFLFYQGALVSHKAYAPILSRLSDAGILVVIRKNGPLCMATASDNIPAMMAEMKLRHGISADSWSVGGHSMGAYAAKDLMTAQRYPGFFDSLIMYGIVKSFGVEEIAGLRALAVTASNDGFLSRPSADLASLESWGMLAGEGATKKGQLCHVMIKGGNHSGFGDYGKQTFPVVDGERSITLEEQHEQIVDATVKFLLPHKLE